jgi:hypothetical protein
MEPPERNLKRQFARDQSLSLDDCVFSHLLEDALRRFFLVSV